MTQRQGRRRVPGRAPTIHEIAEEAGVSRATVSRAFTRPELLRPDTVERVRDIAQRLGYVPNRAARGLSTGRHGNIAVIVPDIANPFFPPLIRAAQSVADSADFCVFLGDSNEDAAREDVLLATLAPQVEGFVLASSRLPDERIVAHAAQRRLVLINRDVKGIPRVLIDSSSGVRAAVEHLVAAGHQHIAYLAGPPGSWSNQQRRRAVRQATSRLETQLSIIASHRPSFTEGVDAVTALLDTGATAVIAFDDLMAHGLLAGLAERGVSVPEQISVVGCDDVLGAMTFPPLTTVSNRGIEAGRAAVSILIDAANSDAGGEANEVRYVLDTELVVRATTGPPRGK